MTRREFVYLGVAAGASSVGVSTANAEARVGRKVAVEGRPSACEIDTARTAVIVVDMQNDFGSKGGMFELAGIDISGIQRAVAPTSRVLTAARNVGIPIIYLKMAYRADLSDLGAPDSVNRLRHLRLNVGKAVTAPNGEPSRILIRDTWNSDILAELKPQAEDTVLYKTRFSGFYKTDLDERLTARDIRTLIITGCTTSICVDSTVRDAMFRDYSCLLMADCMSEPIGDGLPRSNHEASLLAAEVLLGWVSESQHLLTAIQA
jgi:ureidoacrylate peracid hydrolase